MNNNKIETLESIQKATLVLSSNQQQNHMQIETHPNTQIYTKKCESIPSQYHDNLSKILIQEKLNLSKDTTRNKLPKQQSLQFKEIMMLNQQEYPEQPISKEIQKKSTKKKIPLKCSNTSCDSNSHLEKVESPINQQVYHFCGDCKKKFDNKYFCYQCNQIQYKSEPFNKKNWNICTKCSRKYHKECNTVSIAPTTLQKDYVCKYCREQMDNQKRGKRMRKNTYFADYLQDQPRKKVKKSTPHKKSERITYKSKNSEKTDKLEKMIKIAQNKQKIETELMQKVQNTEFSPKGIQYQKKMTIFKPKHNCDTSLQNFLKNRCNYTMYLSQEVIKRDLARLRKRIAEKLQQKVVRHQYDKNKN